MGDAGVVDKNVDAAEMLDDLGDGPLDLGFIRDVGRKTQVTFAEGVGGVPCGG